MSGPANTDDLLTIDRRLDPQIKAFVGAFQGFAQGIRKKYLGAAVRYAAQPVFQTFKSLIPVGPTGNLKSSGIMVIRSYKYTALALVGYSMQQRWTGGDESTQGWHQGFIEFGTKDRKIEPKDGQAIASSWKTRGSFSILPFGDGGFVTDPPYPLAFFKKARRGEVLQLARSPRGGIQGVSPLDSAWERCESACKQRMLSRLEENLKKAVDETARRAQRDVDGKK